MSTFQRPTRNPDGGSYSADEIQLSREPERLSPTDGVISAAWEYVKLHPAETILLAFLSVITGGGNGCNVPSNVGDLDGLFEGDDPSPYEPSSSELDFDFQAPVDLVREALPDLAGAIGAAELGLIAVVTIMVVGLSIVFMILNMAVQGGAAIYWLRLVRGQEAELRHIGNVTKALLPLVLTNLLSAVGLFFGFLCLIIPGIIMSLGWSLVLYVVIDKNLAYGEAIKASWRMTYGYKLELLILFILIALLNFAGILVCCVGLFVTHAIGMGALAITYDRIAEPGNAYLDDSEGGFDRVFE